MCTALLALTITLVAVFPPPAFTQGVPTSITYQGKITDGVGQPLPDGSNAMQFKLFSAETGGAQLWDSGAMNVGVKGGVFSVVLGASPTPPITPATLSSADIWLEVKVGVDPPLPRTKLSSAPFALRAAVAASVAENSITSAKIVDGSVDTADLKDNAVTSAKIQDGAIQLADLGQNGASANQIIKRNSANTEWIVAGDADTLNHNIGISAYHYFVDLQFMHSVKGIHNQGVGSDYYHYNDNYVRRGTHWHNLTTASIKVTNEADSLTDQVRVRIWVCN